MAWAAGLFEGEGCISGHSAGKDGRWYPQLSMTQTDHDVLLRFQRIVGGNVRTRKTQIPRHHKDVWVWSTGGYDRCLLIFDRFRPYLGTRRTNRFVEALRLDSKVSIIR